MLIIRTAQLQLLSGRNPEPNSVVQPCPWGGQDNSTSWIEIELVGEDGQPLPGEEYLVLLPGGHQAGGYLDAAGFARLDGLPGAGDCMVGFPAIDREAWEVAGPGAAPPGGQQADAPPPASTGAVISVQAGDCISSIAFAHGLFTGTVWDHPRNAGLRARRKSPHVLEAGDVVFVPGLRSHQVAAATGRRHRFRRRGVPERLRVQLKNADDTPRAGVAYTLRIAPDVTKTGASDSGGWITTFIPPDATSGVLELPAGEHYALALGHLRPADTLHGLRQRLTNLGYACGGESDDDAPGPLTVRAIEAFVTDDTGTLFQWSPDQLASVQERVRRRHGA